MHADQKNLPTNPLLEREIRPIRNWHEWLERWHSASTVQEMAGLLHVGFDVGISQYSRDEPEYTPFDRVMFYLSVADGWANLDLLSVSGEPNFEYEFGTDRDGRMVKKSTNQLRRHLAEKAFIKLALHYFKPLSARDLSSGYLSNGIWNIYTCSDQQIMVISEFFQVWKREYYGREIRNLNTRGRISQPEKLAIGFLLNLARFLWSPESLESKDVGVLTRVRTARLWMVEVLSVLDRLDMLDQYMYDLEDECVAKLREIAMDNELMNHRHPVSNDRPVRTMEEAYFVGSPAAVFLKKRDLLKGEHDRLKKILSAERKRREVEREIQDLST